MKSFLRRVSLWGFRNLYHGWAWAYDAIASFVSLGRWYDWVGTVQPYLLGPRILEIGPGTGHLLEMLAATPRLRPLGVDKSRQMLRLARNRCGDQVPLLRAVVERLPLKGAAIDTAVATFPPSFVREAGAIQEMKRVSAARRAVGDSARRTAGGPNAPGTAHGLGHGPHRRSATRCA